MFKLNLLTPEKKVIVDQEIAEITVPTKSGEIHVLPGHVPFIGTLGTGILRFKNKGSSNFTLSVVSSGYCEISPEGVNVLTEYIQLKEEVSEDVAKAAIKEVEKKLLTSTLTDAEFDTAITEIQRARAGMSLLN